MALGGWTYSKRLYIHPDNIDAGLTDFPILLKLSASTGLTAQDVTDIFDELASDANRFKIAVATDADVEMYVEIERWEDANEVAELWVKVPSISATGTYIYFYYDSGHADNTTYVGDINSTPGETVWDSGFKLVNHLADDPTGTIHVSNSAGTGDYSSNGSMIAGDLQDAKIGKGLHFDGGDDFLDNAYSATLNNQTDILLECWFNSDILPGGGNVEQLFYARGASGISGALAIDDDQVKATFWAPSYQTILHSTTLSTSTWYYLAARFDVNNPYSIWLNDDKETGDTPTGNTLRGTTDWDIAANNGSECFDGLIDEVRVTTGTFRSDAWVKATYYSQIDGLVEWNADILAVVAEDLEMTGLAEAYKPYDFIQENFEMSDSVDCSGDSVAIQEDFSMADAMSIIAVVQEQIVEPFTMDDLVDCMRMTCLAESDFTMSDEAIGGFEFPAVVSDGFEMADVADAFNWSAWVRANAHRAVPLFFFTLTGAADATTDAEIPIASFQARRRTDNPTYLSVVVPGVDYLEQINDRSNGEMVIEMAYSIAGEVSVREELLRVILEDIRPDQGARNRSVSLSGHKTEIFQVQTVTLEKPSYKSVVSGRLNFRFPYIDLYINPGDTCIVGEDSFRIDYITYMVSATLKVMEMREV